MRLKWLCIGMLIATPSFAAKGHRDAQKEFPAKIKESSGVVKAACGCAPSISVDKATFEKVPAEKIDSYKNNVGYELQYIGEQSKAFCSDAESKKLYCANVKKIVIHSKKDGDIGAVYNKGAKSFAITTSDQSNTGGYKFKEILDSW